LDELEAFISKAFKGKAIVELLQALNNESYESLRLALWVKIDEKKDHHSTCPIVSRRGSRVYHSGKMNDDMIFLKPSLIK
jgi:hypothetical protein